MRTQGPFSVGLPWALVVSQLSAVNVPLLMNGGRFPPSEPQGARHVWRLRLPGGQGFRFRASRAHDVGGGGVSLNSFPCKCRSALP